MSDIKIIIVNYLRYQMKKNSRTEIVADYFMKQSVEAIIVNIEEYRVE